MNRIFKVIWSRVLQRFVVCSEHAKAIGKSSAKSIVVSAALAGFLMTPSFAKDDEEAQEAGNIPLVFTFKSSDEADNPNNFFNAYNWVNKEGNNTPSTFFSNKDPVWGVPDGADWANFYITGDDHVIMEYTKNPENGGEGGDTEFNGPRTFRYLTVHIDDNASLDILLDKDEPLAITNEELVYNVSGKLNITSKQDPNAPGYGKYFFNELNIGSKLEADTDAVVTISGTKPVYNTEHGMHTAGGGISSFSAEIGRGSKGKLSVEKALYSINSFSISVHDGRGEYDKASFFSVGSEGGKGEVSVLQGGKIAVNASLVEAEQKYAEFKEPISNEGNSVPLTYNNILDNISTTSSRITETTIGKSAGTGALNISGNEFGIDFMGNESKATSRFFSGKGMSVGVGEGSSGSISINDGGKLLATQGLEGYVFSEYSEREGWADNIENIKLLVDNYGFTEHMVNRLIASTALQLGVDGGEAHLLVENGTADIGGQGSGFGKEMNRIPQNIGELVVGRSGTGEITLVDEGKVRIGFVYPNAYGMYDEIEEIDYVFLPGEIDGRKYYGKTVLAAGKDATGILNFQTTENKSKRASEMLYSSDISVGLGKGAVNIDVANNEDTPFIFDVRVAEDRDSLYHSQFEKDKSPTELDIGSIDFNILGGVTLLDQHECRAYECVAGEKTFDYSGNTNIVGGTLKVQTENLLSDRSHFDIGAGGILAIAGADQTIKSIHNDGVIDFTKSQTDVGDETRSAVIDSEFKGNQLTINGNYSGKGEIIVNTVWNMTSESEFAQEGSKTDSIVIKGDVEDGTQTTLISKYNGEKDIIGGIWDVVKNGMSYYSLPVVSVEGKAKAGDFIGQAKTVNTGYIAKITHLEKDGRHEFYWAFNSGLPLVPIEPGERPTTPLVPIEPGEGGTPQKPNPEPGDRDFVSNEVPLITQMAAANTEQITLSLGRYVERRGVAESSPFWVRSYGQHSKMKGKNRFSFDANIWGMQLGYDAYVQNQENAVKKAGVIVGYSNNNTSFQDKYLTEWGTADIISASKEAGSGRTSMLSLGGYYTWLHDSGSYLDVVGLYNHIENKYQPNHQADFKQRGYALAFSVEGGYAINFAESNWQLVPQGQLIYQYLHLKDKVYDGAKISGVKGSTVLGRVGAQLNYKPSEQSNLYMGAHLWHQFNKNRAVNYGNSRFRETYAQSWGELTFGGEYEMTNKVRAFGELSIQKNIGSKNREVYRVNVGLNIDL